MTRRHALISIRAFAEHSLELLEQTQVTDKEELKESLQKTISECSKLLTKREVVGRSRR